MNKPPRVIYKGKPKKNSWCRWSVFRVKRRNNSVNIRFTGGTGEGKSWSALSFGEICAKMLGKTFTEENIYFSIKDVIDDVAANEPPPGTIFFIDEQQVEASSRSHQSKRAEAYAIFFSTVRSNRYIIITTLPFSDMELKRLRRFYHVEIECHGANLNTNTVRSTPRFLEYSRTRKDKEYRKRLIITFKDEETGITKSRKLSYWDIPRPSQEIINIFERLKADFKRKLYKRISKELSKEDGEDEEPQVKVEQQVIDTLSDYQKAIYELMSKGIKKTKDLDRELKVLNFYSDYGKVSRNKKSMRKKGVIFI